MIVRSSRRLGGARGGVGGIRGARRDGSGHAASTEVKKVGATIIYKNVASPKVPGDCGVLAILEWKDPTTEGFEPTSWTGHYFAGAASSRTERTISGRPPFHDAQQIADTTFHANVGANWPHIGWSSARRARPIVPPGRSDMLAKLKTGYGTQA